MPFRTWANGDVPQDTDWNDYLQEQVVIRCTSGTRPSSPNDGMLIYETDTKRYVCYEATAAAWRVYGHSVAGAHTPVLTAATTNPTLGSGSIAAARYVLNNGDLCTYFGHISFGTSGANAGSGQYFLSLPATSATGVGITAGSAMIRDASAGVLTPAACYLAQGVTTLSFAYNGNVVTSAVPWVWANSDYFSWNITYQVA